MTYIRWNYGPGSAGLHASPGWTGRYPDMESLLAYLWDRATRGLIVYVVQHD